MEENQMLEENQIVLVNEDGEECVFNVEMTFDIEDKLYVILSEDEESEDVYAFSIEKDENGDEILLPIEDEEEFALVEETYIQLAEEDCCCDDDNCDCHHE